MKFSLFVALSIATAAFAASITPAGIAAENVRTVDAATYKAFANGTLSPADLPPVGRRDLQKRDAGNVYLCTAANWQLYCVYITDAGPGECVELAGDLDNQVSSVGPDPNQTCAFYNQHGCVNREDAIFVRSPGYADLSKPLSTGEGGGGFTFNDVISSYSCTYDFF
ncbi:hypothetical protein DFH08DRAFT_1041590 [Mycena albidolilacea]|uniref:Uncharacterized protein n=1 Tax=Mycena albidolilacea TaxID=1033008 RepID=A0AAD6ZA67_9AGAR|nr:hypothetical protein DFH08DRAFT_1041590 [Mycena albidolilacea]